MRWNLAACVLTTGLLAGCASAVSPGEFEHTETRARARMARNLDPGERDRVADELRAAELRYAAGAPDEATWTVTELYDLTGDSRAAEVLGKFALTEGRFGAAERHFEDAGEAALEDGFAQRRRLDDLLHLVRGFRAYERGALDDAQQFWAAIADPAMRTALARARSFDADEPVRLVRGGAR
jgi:hypothetical protein